MVFAYIDKFWKQTTKKKHVRVQVWCGRRDFEMFQLDLILIYLFLSKLISHSQWIIFMHFWSGNAWGIHKWSMKWPWQACWQALLDSCPCWIPSSPVFHRRFVPPAGIQKHYESQGQSRYHGFAKGFWPHPREWWQQKQSLRQERQKWYASWGHIVPLGSMFS